MEISDETREDVNAELVRLRRENSLLELKYNELLHRNVQLRLRVRELEAMQSGNQDGERPA